MNRDEIEKLKSEVMTLEYQSGLWVTAEDYLDALAQLEDAKAAQALVVEARRMVRVRAAFAVVDEMLKDTGEFTESSWVDLAKAIDGDGS